MTKMNQRMHLGMKIFMMTAWLVLSSVLMALSVSGQEAEPETRHTKAKQVARNNDGSPRIWWNQPRFIEGLALTAEQRLRMDASLKKHLDLRREQIEAVQSAREQLTKTLASGDLAAGEALVQKLGDATGELTRIDNRLTLEVAAALTVKQRGKAGTDFPMLWKRPWIRGGQAGPRNRGRG